MSKHILGQFHFIFNLNLQIKVGLSTKTMRFGTETVIFKKVFS
jgi:hypothetical protein